MTTLTTPENMTDLELRQEFNRIAAIAYQNWASAAVEKLRATLQQRRDALQMNDDQKSKEAAA